MAPARRLRTYLTHDEVAHLLRAAKKSRHGARNHAMILIAYRHGLRASELVNLRWSDVDLERGTIYCRRAKGSRSTVHPLKNDEIVTLDRLRRHRKWQPCDFVFQSERGERMSRSGFWRVVAQEQFEISTPQASNDFRRYQEAVPGNIDYDASEKCYVATPNFRPQFLRLSPERYLRQLEAIRTKAIVKSETWFDELPPYGALPEINRAPTAHALRTILRAIHLRRAISINYRSMSGTRTRTICPHALAHDGYRWHARALSFDHGDFRDYVLGRVLSVGELEPCDVDPSDDLEWQTEWDLKLVAHPGLNAPPSR